MTDHAHHLQGHVPSFLQHFILPKTGSIKCGRVSRQWRDRRSKGSSYDLLSAEVARIVKIEEYVHTPEIEQLFDVGAKRLLLPMASVGDIPTVPGKLFAEFQTSFYADPREAVFKVLGLSDGSDGRAGTAIWGLTIQVGKPRGHLD